MKKFLSLPLFTFLVVFLVSNFIVFSLGDLKEINLYYSDTDGNSKIDNIEIEFNRTLTGNLDFGKLFLYSNTGGLSTVRLNSVSGNSIFSSFYISGNVLGINLVEQDNFLTGLIINNTTSSHLRLKTNAGVGIFDEDLNEIKLFYTSSFNNYKNVFYKETLKNDKTKDSFETGSLDGNLVLDNKEALTQSGDIDLEELESKVEEDLIQTGNLSNDISLDLVGDPEVGYNTGELTESFIGTENQTNEFIDQQNFQVKLLFQNPSYLSGKELELDTYSCLTSEIDCKVNFNLNIDTGSGFTSIPTSKYNCEWDFGMDDFVEEKYKCNPSTIVFPKGTYEVSYKVSEISNPSNYFSRSFRIVNDGYIKPFFETKTIYKEKTIERGSPNIYIETPKIIIQSGLDGENNCKKEDCSVNFIYEKKNSYEACLWSFPGGIFEDGDDKRCNPGYVRYKTFGDFKVTLRVYEVGNESNYKESSIFLKNKKKEIEKNKNKKKEIEKNLEVDDELKRENNLNSTNTGEIVYSLRIKRVLPNPSGKDDLEFIELQNLGTGEINLKGCELDDEINSGSKPYKIDKDLFLPPSRSIKFFKHETNINLNNASGDEVNLLCNSKLIDRLVWDFKVPDDFLVDHVNAMEGPIDEESDSLEAKIGLEDLIDIQKEVPKEKVRELVNKRFTQKIKKDKSGIKIYGKTFPNVKVIIEVSKIKEFSFFISKTYAEESNLLKSNIYWTISDEEGSYEIALENIDTGEFEVKTLLNKDKNYFKIDKKLTFEVDSDYLEYVNSYKEDKGFKANKNTKKEELKKPLKHHISKEILKSHITVQNLARGIGISGNKITCYDLDECKINFDGRKSTGKIKSYFWDFGNGILSNRPNPRPVKFTTGRYIVSLKVSDKEDESISYFFVEVEGKAKDKQEEVTESKKLFSETAKTSFTPSTAANNSEYKDLKTHIFMSLLALLLFLVFSFVILKKEKVI